MQTTDGQPITQLSEPMTIEFSYSDDELTAAGVDASDLLNGALAVSGWQNRDYDTPSAQTGCGTAKKRTCLMVDQTNKNGGTTAAASNGPDTNAVVNTATGRPVTTVSGVFAEDYYFDSTVRGANGQCLDKHNGHEHDSYGCHYHTTVTQETDGRLTPRFPYVVGLQYYGTLPQGTFSLSDQRPSMWAP